MAAAQGTTRATPAGGVVDITGVYPAPSITMTIVRVFVLGIGWLVVSALWFFIWLQPVKDADMGLPFITFGLIAAAPFVYGFYWFMSRITRWNTGVSTFLSANQFTPAERSRPIPGMDITAGEVLARVETFAGGLGEAMIVREGGARLAQARGLQAGGVALLFAAIYFGVKGGGNSLIALLCIGAMSVPFARAAKLLQPSIATLLATDRRKPILLLRAFKDDAASAYQSFNTWIGRIMLGRRFEQGIAGGLSTFGPLIAVGRPGEELPEIGAARSYLSDAEWQPAVLRWIEDSLFIIMVAGATQGITWELQKIVERQRQRHLFILLPPGNNQARWQNVVTSLADTDWHAQLAGLDFSGLILVRLRPGGSVTATRRRGLPVMQDYELALAIAVYEEFCRGDSVGRAA